MKVFVFFRNSKGHHQIESHVNRNGILQNHCSWERILQSYIILNRNRVLHIVKEIFNFCFCLRCSHLLNDFWFSYHKRSPFYSILSKRDLVSLIFLAQAFSLKKGSLKEFKYSS